MKVFRQGDVVLRELNWWERLLRRGTWVSERVLARGERTGHMHRLRGDVAVLEDGRGNRTLSVRGVVSLSHEEHPAIEIPPGEYAVRVQREFVAQDRPRSFAD